MLRSPWEQISLTQPLTSFSALAKFLSFSKPLFLICKMRKLHKVIVKIKLHDSYKALTLVLHT